MPDSPCGVTALNQWLASPAQISSIDEKRIREKRPAQISSIVTDSEKNEKSCNRACSLRPAQISSIEKNETISRRWLRRQAAHSTSRGWQQINCHEDKNTKTVRKMKKTVESQFLRLFLNNLLVIRTCYEQNWCNECHSIQCQESNAKTVSRKYAGNRKNRCYSRIWYFSNN